MGSLRPVIFDWFAPRQEPRRQVTVAARLLVFAAFLVAIYPAVWLIVNGLRHPLAALLADLVRLVAALVVDYPMRFWAQGTEVHFSISWGRGFEAWLETQPIFANLPILLALVAVTPGLRWQRRLAVTVAAGALLLVTHVCFLWIKVQVTLITAGHSYAGSPGLWQTLDDVFEVTGKTFFPVLIWLLLAFPYMLGTTDRSAEPRPATPSRNAPCPCGSGKKFKKCCGG